MAAASALRSPPALEFLRRTWVQRYQHVEGTVLWRETKTSRVDPPHAVSRYQTGRLTNVSNAAAMLISALASSRLYLNAEVTASACTDPLA